MTWILWTLLLAVVAVIAFCFGQMAAMDAEFTRIQRESDDEAGRFDQ